LNDVGNSVRINVPNSYRLGVELQGKVIINDWLNITANATFSKNKIKTFTGVLNEYDSNYNYIGQQNTTYNNTDIAYSPSIIAAGSINFTPIKNGEINLISKYVNKQYLDNTSDTSRMINGYFAENARVSYTLDNKLFKKTTLIFQVNNLFSENYLSTGSAYPDVESGKVVNYNYYFPMAFINYMVGVDISL
jgi:iron complex outermembrane receptor protein